MALGALIVTMFFWYRRRRAQRRAYHGQGLRVYSYKQDEEKDMLDAPLPTGAEPNTKVMDWIQRNRVVSVSTISSFSSPTLIESASVGTRTSISAYSQASAAPGDRPEEGGRPRPPGLYRINE
ncbi:hypothetical protein DFH09DRAFT_211773 [Mycena vulgaris]|nr:hypothetical protein DFH09DRAFT_211773 [Mycena vulgaris]